LLQEIPNKIRAFAFAARERCWTAYLRRRRPVAYAPYSIALYRDLLRQLKARRDVTLPPFDVAGTSPDHVNFFLRHDVDTAECVAKLRLIAAQNVAESVAAAVFIRCDGAEYLPRDARSAVAECRANGMEVGLHSSAYVEGNAEARLREELAVFRDTFGFAARTVTIHGLGEYRLAERNALVRKLSTSLAAFQLSFTDAHESLRVYDHVITDCHLDSVNGRRFIYRDMLRLPPLLRKGRAYLVLTHPCYWKP
jgi:hypothetical protein